MPPHPSPHQENINMEAKQEINYNGLAAANTKAGVIALLAQRAADSALKVQSGSHLDAAQFIVLRDAAGNEAVHALTERKEAPHRKTGITTLFDLASFVEFVTYHGINSPIYATLNPAQFLSILNDHEGGIRDDNAGHRDFRAIFELKCSDEWNVWTKHNGAGAKFAGTEAFATFLEENHFDMVEPDGATFIDLANNFRVNESVRYAKQQNLTNGEVQFAFNKITDGQTASGAGGTIKMPTKFKIAIPVFKGIGQPKHEIEAHFRYRVGTGGELSIWYDLIRTGKVMEKAFQEIWEAVSAQTKQPVLFAETK
jgi:uncharacterized protein YfdQ (DUF2303 family)